MRGDVAILNPILASGVYAAGLVFEDDDVTF
jgi:hypothetical protein